MAGAWNKSPPWDDSVGTPGVQLSHETLRAAIEPPYANAGHDLHPPMYVDTAAPPMTANAITETLQSMFAGKIENELENLARAREFAETIALPGARISWSTDYGKGGR
jgi:hypothetical protein